MDSFLLSRSRRLPLSTVGAIEFAGVVALAAAGAYPTKRARSRSDGRRRVDARRASTDQPAGRVRLCLRELHLLHAVRRARSPSGEHNHRRFRARSDGWHRPARRRHACRCPRRDAARTRCGPTGIRSSRLARWGVAVGVSSSVIPYVTDQLALARLPRPTFALMLALLPATATVVGLVVLTQGADAARSGRHRARDRWCRTAPSNELPRQRGEIVQNTSLGSSGLKVSRICLGMMSYGDPAERQWHLREDAAEPIVRRAVEAGVTFFDTADMYSDGASEEITGRLLGKLFAARRLRARHQGLLPDGYRGRTTAACRASTSWPRSTPRCAGWAPTTSTCTRSTAGTTRRRSRRPWRRCTTWSGPARPATSAPPACTPGSSRRRSTPPGSQRLDQVRLDAEPLQPGLPGGGAGDDPALPRPGRGRDPVEPAGARAARRQPEARRRPKHRPAGRTRSPIRCTPTTTSTSSTSSAQSPLGAG